MHFTPRDDLALNITNACNFSCPHCLREGQSAAHLDVALLDRVLPEVRRLGFTFAALTGGEPCLHPAFDELVATIVRHDLRFNFVTNGFVFERYLPIITRYRSHLSNIGVSIDGAYAGTHDGLRRSGSFERVTEAVRAFTAQDIPVTANTLVTRRNLDELPEILTMVQDLGAYELWLAGLIPTVRTPPDLALSMAELREAARTASDCATARCFPLRLASCFVPIDGLFFCGAALLPQPAINPSGELVFCCNTIGRGAVVGSLAKSGFGELYGQAMEVGQRILQRRLKELSTGDPAAPATMTGCAYCHQALGDERIAHFTNAAGSTITD